jgi:hypothetical protein
MFVYTRYQMAKLYKDNSHLIMGLTQSQRISRAVPCSYPKQKGFIMWPVIYYKNRKPLQTHFQSVTANVDFHTHVGRVEKIEMI